MRVIARSRLNAYGRTFPSSRGPLRAWYERVRLASWDSLSDARSDFPAADGVVVASGRVVTVFNVGGNRYRPITAIHYNRKLVYILRFLTHAEYDKDAWKDVL